MSAYDPYPWLRWASWRVLLFERGEGWLRWGMDHRDAYAGYENPPEPYTVAPPLRQCVLWLRQVLTIPKLMLFGVWMDEPGAKNYHRYRFSWEEARPCWPGLDEPDRGHGVWR